MLSRPVISGKVMERGAVLQMDNFYWKHPLKEVHVKGTLLVDASSRVAVVRIWRNASRQELLGNVSASEARQMLQESWFKFYGRPETVMTDPEGCFRERLFREWLASKNVKWDPQPAEAAWRIGILDKVLDVLKNAATRCRQESSRRHFLQGSVRRLHRGSQRVTSSERLFTFPTAHWSIPTCFATGW